VAGYGCAGNQEAGGDYGAYGYHHLAQHGNDRPPGVYGRQYRPWGRRGRIEPDGLGPGLAGERCKSVAYL
jgi:hypothetical protein